MLTVSGAAIFVVHCLLLLVSGDGTVWWSDVGRLDVEFKYLGGVNGLLSKLLSRRFGMASLHVASCFYICSPSGQATLWVHVHM
jgi:hypothetical protein